MYWFIKTPSSWPISDCQKGLKNRLIFNRNYLEWLLMLIQKYLIEKGESHCIIYLPNINKCKSIRKIFNELLCDCCEMLTYENSKIERDNIITNFNKNNFVPNYNKTII